MKHIFHHSPDPIHLTLYNNETQSNLMVASLLGGLWTQN